MPILQTNSRIIKSVNREISSYVSRINVEGGSISDASIQAHRAFIQTLKQNNLWNKLLEISTYAGDNLNAALVKLKHPVGVQSTLTNVGFVGVDYSENSGIIGNGSTKYLRTGFNPLLQLPNSINSHFSIYIRNTTKPIISTGTTAKYLGIDTPTYNEYSLEQTSTAIRARQYNGIQIFQTTTDPSGYWNLSTRGLNDSSLYKNGTLIANDTSFVYSNFSDLEMPIFALNSNGSFTPISGGNVSFHSFGYSLTGTDAAIVYNAVQTLQTALGRQV